MIDSIPDNLEARRVTDGVAATSPEWGLCGVFEFPAETFAQSFGMVRCIVDDGTGRHPETDEVLPGLRTGWEHVSITEIVGSQKKTPSWEVMSRAKDIFWKPTERVVQYHPPKDEHVNCHPNVLHLWRPIDEDIVAPPAKLVGPPFNVES